MLGVSLLALMATDQILPGTGRGTATRSGVVEGDERSEHGDVDPLHHSALLHGPPPRSGEDFDSSP